MWITYGISILIVFGMLAGWVAVQHFARRFAARHPEFGRARQEGAGCGMCGSQCEMLETDCELNDPECAARAPGDGPHVARQTPEPESCSPINREETP
jgi:hypothetical protein